ncbi:MAG: conjugal transfer protein TraG N-terminal domain-containing protein, partial [Holosporales bacterium]
MIIKVFGGIDFYADILNSLAALFFGPKGSTGEHWAQFLKTLGGVSGLTAAAMLYFKTYKPVHLGRFLAMLIFAEALFLSPTKVNLKDEISGDVRTVDNVPWIVGFLGSTTTSMSFSLTEMLETLFQIPDETKFHKSGMALYATLLAESTQISIKDPLLKRNMDDFIGQCVVHTAMIGQKYTIKDLQESSDLWGLISQNASPILGLYIHQAGGQSTYMSCADAAKTLTGKWNDETQSAIAYLERLILPNSGSRPPVENQLNQVARQSIDAKLNDTYDLLQVFKVGASDSAAAIRQQMTINALVSGVQNKLSVLDAGENYALSKAMLQQQDTWNLTGKMAVRTLPQIKNVIECILWIFSILIFVLLFMPSGFKTLGIYVQMLVWVNLWAPFYAILNLFIATGTKLRIASALGTQGITLGNIQDVASISSSMASAAEYLTLSIPVMAWALLKGGTYSLGQMVQIAGATAQSASGSVAAEMAGGNYSHGNISMNDISHDNVNAFQQMTAPSFHSTGMSMVDQSGTKWTEYGSGAMVADTSASMSQLPVNASLSEGLEKAAHSNLNQAQSMMASSQKEFS